MSLFPSVGSILQVCVVNSEAWVVTEAWCAGAAWAVVAGFLSDILLVTYFASLLCFLFALCWWNLLNKVPFCKSDNIFLPWNIMMGAIVLTKYKDGNDIKLKFQYALPTPIFLEKQETVKHCKLQEVDC